MIWFTYFICIAMVFGSLVVAFRVFRITNEFPRDKVYYGELHSLHPDIRSFEVFEEVYYKGERWYIEYWSRHYGQDSFHLSLVQRDGYYKVEISSVDSREVKKIIKGEQS